MGEVIDIGGGIRLACDDVGRGRPVLLIHGVSMSRRPAEELDMLISETQKLGPNAATCILLDQSLRDFRPVVGSYELPTLCSWGRDEKLVPDRRRRVAGGPPARLPARLRGLRPLPDVGGAGALEPGGRRLDRRPLIAGRS